MNRFLVTFVCVALCPLAIGQERLRPQDLNRRVQEAALSGKQEKMPEYLANTIPATVLKVDKKKKIITLQLNDGTLMPTGMGKGATVRISQPH